MPLPVIDTRHHFRPACAEIVSLLRTLGPEDWAQPAVGAWTVRDVVAHLLDTGLRRLSMHRDHHVLPSPQDPNADLPGFVNELNAVWIRAADRLSPRVLMDLYAVVSHDLAGFVESIPIESAAFFPVSWADENQSAGWLDIGREFTEVWHHGMQIREAAGAGAFSDWRWLYSVLGIALNAVPRAYRTRSAPPGTSIGIEIHGAAGGAWTLKRLPDRWDISEGRATDPTVRAVMTDDTAWRLFFNGFSHDAAAARVRIEGDAGLGLPLLQTRAVVI